MKKRPLGVKSVETKHMEERAEFFRALKSLDRRSFMKVSAAAFGAVAARGLVSPHSFQPVSVAFAQTATGEEKSRSQGPEGFRFAYVSDSHLYERKVNDRFVNALLRAVDDVNALDPQPDFVLFGGDLAQLGQAGELELGAQILKNLKAPVRMMVGEHDWFLDMGEKWRALFGKDVYSFEHKGVHCVVLNSILQEDFWTKRGLQPMERMKIVAGLDNGIQSRFQVGEEQRKWLAEDLAKVPATTPVIVFSHSPLYKLYRPWNFWTDDAEQVQALLKKFQKVTVFHGHTHQVLTNRIGNIHFHGFLSTAWPWPYAPEGLPELTVQMGRPDPFNPNDGCGDGYATVHPDGLADKVYNLWNRNPMTIPSTYLQSRGAKSRPPVPKLTSF
jgi:3',5'-cyclic AMP phosphodiesterase CpdA